MTPPPFDGVVSFGDLLAFSSFTAETGWELWLSDGTEAGTRMLVDLVPGPGSSTPRKLLAASGALYFEASQGNGRAALWRSDGTAAGTTLLAELADQEYVAQQISVYDPPHFATHISGTGSSFRLWESDGTAEGTRVHSALPQILHLRGVTGRVALGSSLVFPGSSSAMGIEPWALDLDLQPPCAADCDGDGITSSAEVAAVVRVALLQAAFPTCARADREDDGRVTVDEIVLAIRQRMVEACAR